MILRAVLLARAGQFEEAAPILRRAFADGSEPKAEVAEGLARVSLGTYRFHEASSPSTAGWKLAPDDARPYLLQIEIHKRVAHESEALFRTAARP